MREAPLAGIRVVDMADERGELCGRLLADLGADVVRVEPPEGAVSRRIPPFGPDGTSLYFAFRNANKRGAVIDLPRERAALLSMLRGADVWIESTSPGTLAPYGLDPARIAGELPHLVVTSISDFGQTGPYRSYVATNLVALAMGGLLYNSGTADLPPLCSPGAMAYDAAGIVGAFATLTAYWQRLRTGRGQHVDLSVMETVAQLTDWALPNASQQGFANYVVARGGSGPVYPLYPCADGYARVVILSMRQWRAMREWLDEPAELRDESLDTILGRLSRMDVLEPCFVELFRRYKKSDLAAEAQRRGIPITPVLSAEEVLACEHFAARETFVRAEIARGVTGTVASGFVELDGERFGVRTRSPSIGEHAVDWDARPTRSAPATTGRPFTGLHVLDFGIGGVGVEAARLFAEYGADVIRIESRAYPDFIRTVGNTEMSASFASSSRSKRSLGVNLKTSEGVEIVRRLVAMADVVIENSHTGAMESMGLGYDAVKAINPRIVMVSSQFMGSRGPWADWTGYGPSTRPASGLTWLWNWPGSDEDMPPGSRAIYPDHLVGRVCAFAAVAGLIGRERHGTGVHAEVAQVEAVINTLGDLYLKESLQAGAVRPSGNTSERGAPWGVYRCKGEERWCAITVRDDDEWRRLVSAIGEPAWARHPALATTAGRIAARSPLDRELEAWTSERDDREVMTTLQAAGVAAGRMSYPADGVGDPHLVARGYPRPIDQPDLRQIVLEGPAFRGSLMPDVVTTPAPKLGEHTREVCAELLGMPDGEIDGLIEAGVLEVAKS